MYLLQTMKTEKILASLFLLTYILKCLAIPGGAFMMLIVLMALSFVYFPGGFYFLADGNLKKQNIALSIVTGMVLSIVVLGLLFKLMYWPGAALMLLVSLGITLPLTIAFYFIRKKEGDELKGYYGKLLGRTVAGAVIALTFYLVPMSVLIRVQHWQDPELARRKILFYSDESNEDYKKQYKDYLKKEQGE